MGAPRDAAVYRDDGPVVLCEAGEPGESWGDGLLNGDLSISVFFTGDEMPPSMSSVQLRLLLVGELGDV